jgi:trehalose-phosphatase
VIPDAVDPVDLAADLGAPEDLLVVLDFDGTLARIVDDPDAASLLPGAAEALHALAAATTVAIVSGRDLDDLRGRLPESDAVLIGGHGAQIDVPGGEPIELVDLAALADVLDAAEDEITGLVGTFPGWLVERKPASLAVHHRLVPPDDEERLLPRVRAMLDRYLTRAPGFEVLDGKAVVELRPQGVDKGRALERLLARNPGRRPLVVGDDVTDEDAFETALAHGGRAVLVDSVGRATRATDRLASPAAVVTFLTRLAGLQGGR